MVTLQFIPSSLQSLSAMSNGAIDVSLSAMGRLRDLAKDRSEKVQTGAGEPSLRTVNVTRLSQSPMVEIAYTEIEKDNFAVLEVGRDLDNDRLAEDVRTLAASDWRRLLVRVAVESLTSSSFRTLANLLLASPGGLQQRPFSPLTHDIVELLSERSGKRWKTGDARQNLKDVLNQADEKPQIIERDGEDVFLVSSKVLRDLSEAMSPAQMAAHIMLAPAPSSGPAPAIKGSMPNLRGEEWSSPKASKG